MAIYTVTNTDDSGSGSLREAIASANNNPGADTINFSGEVFLDDTADTITLTSGELSITESVTINGLGSQMLTVSGNTSSSVFNISLEEIEVTINGLTIANGYSDNAENGGVILLHSGTNLNLNNSIVSGNSATVGGIHNNKGNAILTDSTVSGNMGGTFSGGSISNSGTSTLNMNRSNVSDNSKGAFGGGISNSNTATLTNSTVFSNRTLRPIDVSFGTLGGILNRSTTIPNNTIVGSNLDNNLPEQALNNLDVSGNFLDSFNPIDDSSSSTGLTDDTDGNIVGTSDAPIDTGLEPKTYDNASDHSLVPDDDIIDGGNSDTLTGSAGADTFVLSPNDYFFVDTITDFDFLEGDTIDLAGGLTSDDLTFNGDTIGVQTLWSVNLTFMAIVDIN